MSEVFPYWNTMNRLFRKKRVGGAMAGHKKYSIVVYLLLLLPVFNSCNDSNNTGPKEIAIADSNGTVQPVDTIGPQSVDSFLHVLREAQKIYVGDFDTMSNH